MSKLLQAKSSKESLTGEPEANPPKGEFFDEEGEDDFYFDELSITTDQLENLQRVSSGQNYFSSYESVDRIDSFKVEEIFPLIGECAERISDLGIKVPVEYRIRSDDVSVVSECGDDHIAYGNQPGEHIMESVLSSRLFNMKISISDSFLSEKFGNYTEKWILAPMDRIDLAGFNLKVNETNKTTPVIDIPSLRATLPVSSQVRGERQSIEGKCALFSRALSHSRGTADELMVQKASIFQDVLLSVHTKGGKFPYLPESLGGLSKPFPMSCPENVHRATKTWKRGRYEKLIKTILVRSYNLLNSEKGFVKDPFLEKVKAMYSGYDPTYTYLARNMAAAKGKVPPWAAKFRMGHFSHSAVSNSALRRLRAEGVIVAEKDLIIANEVEEHTRSMLTSNRGDFRELKEQELSSYKERILRSKSFGVLYKDYARAPTEDTYLSSAVLQFSIRLDMDTSKRVSKFLFGEQFYLKEALDQIYLRGPTKVNFPLLWKGKRIFKPPPTLGTICDDVDEEKVLEVEKLLRWCVKGEGDPPPQSLLEDDDIIVERVLKDMRVSPDPIFIAIVVTNDVELCKRINLETEAVVVRLPPEMLHAMVNGMITQISPTETDLINETRAILILREKLKKEIGHRSTGYFPTGSAYLDTGSWAAELEKFEVFPFTKHELITDRRREYFEIRPIVEKGPGMIDAFYKAWPSGPNYVFDKGRLVRGETDIRRNQSTGRIEVINPLFPFARNTFRGMSNVAKSLASSRAFKNVNRRGIRELAEEEVKLLLTRDPTL